TTPENLDGHDVVFFALPHGASGELTEQLTNVRLVIDCGADHRLVSAEDWADFYGGEHHGAWSYGVPELIIADRARDGARIWTRQREHLAGATRIAAPG